jgi:hypothetical protein
MICLRAGDLLSHNIEIASYAKEMQLLAIAIGESMSLAFSTAAPENSLVKPEFNPKA